MTNPPRPRGRPPLPAGEAKRYPLAIRSTKEMKDALVRAAKLSGRSLAQEIEYRLERSLQEDIDKEEGEARLHEHARRIMKLSGEFWEANPELLTKFKWYL
jgi:hypothetical protein